MTATANDILNRAGRRLRILAGSEAYDADEQTDGITLLNDMMFGFGPKGIQYVHAILAGGDTVNMPDELINDLVWMMAEALASEYGVAINPTDMEQIRQAKLELQAAYLVINPAVPDRALRRRWPGSFNFVRG